MAEYANISRFREEWKSLESAERCNGRNAIERATRLDEWQEQDANIIKKTRQKAASLLMKKRTYNSLSDAVWTTLHHPSGTFP